MQEMTTTRIQSPRAYFILANASVSLLPTNRPGPSGSKKRKLARDGQYILANADDHASILSRDGKDPAHYRPDITHQCLMMILDSPLNLAGKVGAVFITTVDGVCIEVKPSTRIPRSFKRFCGLMAQVLREFKVRAGGQGSGETLLKVVKNPVTTHLPINTLKIGLSTDAEFVRIRDYVKPLLEPCQSIAFFVGAYPKGKDNFPDVDANVSLSYYSTSAAVCCANLTCSMGEIWGIK